MKFTNLWKYTRDTSRVDITFRIGKVIFFELFWDNDGEWSVTFFNFRLSKKAIG